LQEVGAPGDCYSLDLECLPKAPVLKA
jgi:hypothetical protein